MALIRDYDLTGGILVEDAYFVITTFTATKILREPIPDTDPPEMQISQKWNAFFLVSVFKSKAAREAGVAALSVLSDSMIPALFSTSFIYDPEGDLPVVQAYAHLMAQPYFENATVDTDS